MKKALRTLNYIVILLLTGSFFTACFDDEEIDYGNYNDLILSNIAFGTLPRTMHTTNKAGGDSTYYSTVQAATVYPFTIDQLNNVAYNLDSLPYGVQADKIIFSAFSVKDGTATLKKLSAEGDTLYATADTLDFSCGFREFNLYGNDGTSRRTYRVEVRIHQQKPDSLTWTHYSTDEWNAQQLNCGHTGNEYSAAGLSFRLADSEMQVFDNGSQSFVADKIDADEIPLLPTDDMAWISLPSRNIKSITEVLLYGTRSQADSLSGVLWRRNIDTAALIETAWEFLPPTFGSPFPVPSFHTASLLPYDKGVILVGIKNDGTIGLKYTVDRGRTWKDHPYLVLNNELKTKKVTYLKAGIDAHSNLWLLIDDQDVWRGRAHSVDWANDRRIFED